MTTSTAPHQHAHRVKIEQIIADRLEAIHAPESADRDSVEADAEAIAGDLITAGARFVDPHTHDDVLEAVERVRGLLAARDRLVSEDTWRQADLIDIDTDIVTLLPTILDGVPR